MVEILERYVDLGRELALGSGPWLAFNATLATIPAVLAVALFHRRVRRGPAWWTGLAAFVLFLPNAPYVLTDVIHLRWMVAEHGDTPVQAVVPAVALAGLVVWGLGAYAVALAELDRLLAREGWWRHRSVVRAGVHLLCAFGVVLGRLPRLHSWHVLTRPGEAVDGVAAILHPLLVPLVIGLALVAAVGAWTVTVLARALGDRGREIAASARSRFGPALP